LHYAAIADGRDCIEWVLANTTIDVNSPTTSGETPIMKFLESGQLGGSKLLVEKGANLFMKNSDGERAIDRHVEDDPDYDVLGPQVLQHALDLRWSSVKHLLLISTFYETSDAIPFSSSSSSSSSSAVVPQRRSSRIAAPSHSAHLASSVFTITGLVRHIAEYLIRTDLIVRDPATKKKDMEEKEPDDVKRRIEATLAAAREESNKRVCRNK
jgi:hypothetical protein